MHSLVNSRIERFCYSQLKILLFSIQGHCKQTGYCCQHIELVFDYKKILTVDSFKELLKKEESMACFEPVLNDDESVRYFNCSMLDEKNRCKQYAIRPRVCRQYPYSVFVSDQTIRSGCGYFLQQDSQLPMYASKSMKQKMQVLLYNNAG